MHRAKIKNGKLEFTNRQRFIQILKNYEGKEVMVSVEKWVDKRTIPQNKFYWLYLEIISNETGHDPNELHDFFKVRFLPPRFKNLFGQEAQLPPTTTSLDKLDFTNYISRIEALTQIPSPNTEDYFV